MEKNITELTWVTINKFSALTGFAADTIRKNIRAGGFYARYSLKREHTIIINYQAWYHDNNQEWKMAA